MKGNIINYKQQGNLAKGNRAKGKKNTSLVKSAKSFSKIKDDQHCHNFWFVHFFKLIIIIIIIVNE